MPWQGAKLVASCTPRANKTVELLSFDFKHLNPMIVVVVVVSCCAVLGLGEVEALKYCVQSFDHKLLPVLE